MSQPKRYLNRSNFHANLQPLIDLAVEFGDVTTISPTIYRLSKKKILETNFSMIKILYLKFVPDKELKETFILHLEKWLKNKNKSSFRYLQLYRNVIADFIINVRDLIKRNKIDLLKNKYPEFDFSIYCF